MEIGREWVREMAELTRKYQTKLEEVQSRNKELRGAFKMKKRVI